jgi:histidyl-tRNA synthetase
VPGSPGVGISFGAERIYDVMESLNLFPPSLSSAPRILFIPLDEKALTFAFTAATELRKHHISTDIYPEPAKLQKQMRYANQLGVPFVAPSEMKNYTECDIENMISGPAESDRCGISSIGCI